MKKMIFPALACLMGLNACTGMMYGNQVAPVTSQNMYYEKPVAVAGNKKMFTPAPAPRYPAPQPIQLNQPQINQPQPAPVRPPVTVNTRPAQYQTKPPVVVAPEDGWSIRPSNEAPQSASDSAVVDTPKEQSMEPAADQSVAAAPVNDKKNEPKPIRPNVNSEETARETASATEQQTAALTPAAKKPAKGNSSVNSLLKQASSALGKGDLDGAVAYLQDAQRLDSSNPKILYDIANIRYHQGKYNEAESAASRVVRVGASDAMMKKAWSLIANSRKALGDNQGAITAAERAASF